jgi:parallel beta-helix repeat protein
METRKAKTRTVAMVVLCGILVYALIATGGSLEPVAPPGPTMKTLDEVEPRIPISSLPCTISTSGSYYLTGDLTATGTGIIVNADNVTIDLMGYSLIGPDSGMNYGIYMIGRNNVEVRNGTVRDFGWNGIGIYEASTTAGKGHRVIAVRAVSNGYRGIYLVGDGHLVKDCTAVGNGYYGIYVGTGCTVTGNTASNNQSYGITTYRGCTVTGNTTCYNQNYGIYGGIGCTVTGNTAYNNQGHGIFANPGCTVTGNTAYYNQYHGIALGGNNLVDQNTAYVNNQSGGSYVNMDLTRTDCTYGVNHAP